MIRLILITVIFSLFLPQSDKNWEKTDKGVVVQLKGSTGKSAKLLKVEVINNNILHVVATPSDKFSEAKEHL